MSKQLVRVGIQTNYRFLPENRCALTVVYQIYTRGAKRDRIPHWENVEKFIKDLKGTWLNGGVQIEQRN